MSEPVLFIAESKILLKSANNVLVMVNPVGRLPGFSSQTELRDSTNDPSEEKRIRVGINGMLHLNTCLKQLQPQKFKLF